MNKQKNWYVYIVECRDGSLYTGITTDIENRVKMHNSGKGSKSIVKSKRPVKAVYLEEFENKSLSSKREYEIKQLSRKQKLDLISKGP